MAKFDISTNDPLTKKIYEESLIREAQVEDFFSPLVGGMGDNIVWEKKQLEKSRGDAIKFGFGNRLMGKGRTGNEPLEGFEERIMVDADEVKLELYRHAVRDEGAMARQRAAFNVTVEQKEALKTWVGEKLEELKFEAALSPFTTTTTINNSGVFSVAANEGAAKSGIASNHLITPNGLSALRRFAANGGNFDGSTVRTFEPIKPVKIKGKSYYVLLTSHEVTYDMQYNQVFSNAWKDARERSIDNPLFKIADIIWDGVIVIGHERVPTFNDGGGAAVHGCRSVLLGAGSILWAWGQRVEMAEEKFDYGDEYGMAVKFIAGCKTPKKGNHNYGSLGLITACSKLA